ncbi:MAG: heparinase II/III family protein [Candidatus Latescibacterota bacterium]|nr:heparinase II/III family protein [Candidatus Latescibacterota bacterium]
MRTITAAFFAFYLTTFVDAQTNLLSGKASELQLKEMLPTFGNWKPFPNAGDRDAWESLPEKQRAAAIIAGEEALEHNWPALKATHFLDYVRTGDRNRYQRERGQRRNNLSRLVAAECVEGKGRFVDQIANGVWAMCEETWWGVPAHVRQSAGRGLPDRNEPNVALFSAETAAQLAWTLYMVGSQLEEVSPLIVLRVQSEIDRQILTPALERDDFWWMGFGRARSLNNWNPWICSNWLATVLLVEQDKDRRVKSVAKIMRVLDNFLNPYPEDGGCDEGPGYWSRAGGSLFDCLDIMHSVTNGQFSVYDNGLVKDIGRFIYRVHIAGDYFVNFADASPKRRPGGDLVYRYGKAIDDQRMMTFGAWGDQRSTRRRGRIRIQSWRGLQALFNKNNLLELPAEEPLLRDVWLPHTQIFAARDRAGFRKGLYVAAKGGHNNESHNHNDIGNFVVYNNGLPLLIDVGVGTYTAKTFSSKRYEIWTMQSAYHNLPTVNGVMQRQGRSFAAKDLVYNTNNSVSEFSLDISSAYPEDANLESWNRTIRLNRGKNVEIIDKYRTDNPAP